MSLSKTQLKKIEKQNQLRKQLLAEVRDSNAKHTTRIEKAKS